MDSGSGFLLLVLLTISCPFFANGDTNLIQKTCKTTKFYDLCLSSLQSDSTSPQADTKGLAIILAKVAMDNATCTNSYLSSNVLVKKTNDTLMKKVLKQCADRYMAAGTSLQNSVEDLSSELYDYAYMHVMAASDYANACHNAFKRYPNLVYPLEIATREEGLKHICDVVMAIIDSLESDHLKSIFYQFTCNEAIGDERYIAVKGSWKGMMNKWQGSWCIFGDLNVVRCNYDRVNSQVNGKEVREFNDFINDMRLVEIPMGGRKFTRISDDGLKFSKMDRFLMNDDFSNLASDLCDGVGAKTIFNVLDNSPLFDDQIRCIGPCVPYVE
ncbi:cell wall/vacuolar inhibitor of fructosidase 2 [Tanacetum coccineum]